MKIKMCACKCGKTSVAVANHRLRKIPWGFDETSWPKFLEAGRKRLEDERAG